MEQKQNKISLRVLALITTQKLAERAEKILKKNHLPLQYHFIGEGTASSEIMDMLGLGSIDKSVLLSVMPTDVANTMLEKLRSELRMSAINSGIAFTIPVNGANNFMIRMLTQNMDLTGTENSRKDEETMAEMKHVLITAIVNRGFSNDVMAAAREAGARGGTVVHSRQTVTEETAGFWGTSVQDEKEIVMILSDVENKVPIMQSIGEKCGVQSKAKGIVMSMPIDSVIGI